MTVAGMVALFDYLAEFDLPFLMWGEAPDDNEFVIAFREGDVAEPNEFDDFRRRVAHEERRRRTLVTVLEVLTALALLAIAALVLKMIFY